MVDCDWDEGGVISFGVIVAIMSVCVADDVVLPSYISFMDVLCDPSANIARFFKLIRRSLSSVK